MARVQRIRGVSKAIVILVVIAGLAASLGGALAPAAADSADDFLAGRISEDEFLESYGALALAQIVGALATLATAILTIIWMYRLSSNVRAFGRATFWAPLFAVFGWVLPPVVFVIPFLMLRELWKASSPEAVDGTDTWKRQPENPILWAWWLCFGIIPIVLAALEFDLLFGGSGFGGDAEALAESTADIGTISLVSGLTQLAAAVFWVLFVRSLTARHTTLTNET